ncbi:MFS transporter [Paenibacillus xylaniclasticus]|uniref:MFS transporter n=1 Tax=Paenibacillus xylaniclasticus TaxID=588083 RepID=UPI000FDA488B|nr:MULTISPECIES: MFS transporter [Paenibacillus]GFN31651.1 MFS transporter [Paenibacillus curdlanolyticus]
MNSKKAVRGWLMYDWANSAFVTTMIAAVMPVYYEKVAGKGLGENMATVYWANTQSIGALIVALLSPVLGAIADYSGSKIKFLSFFAILGSIASLLCVLVGEGDWLLASVLVIVGLIGFGAGNTFYDALLIEIAPADRRDQLSSQGYAWGYLGGGLLLGINIVMIQKWELLGFASSESATRIVFMTVGVWWLLFAIPIVRHVKERQRQTTGQTAARAVKIAFQRLGQTFRRIKQYPELLKYMVSYWFFNDGINTVIVMATVYGSSIGIGMNALITALLITQFIGFPSSLLFGRFARKLGAKKGLYLSLTLYIIIVTLGFFMENALHFYILATMVGLVQGGSQALARSLYAELVPPARSAEFFGFLTISSKFSSVVGPLVFAITAGNTDSSRIGILSLIAFFVIGIALLWTVDLAKGKREAVAEQNVT